MARIQRQELKHDEFVDTLDATLIWVEDNWRALLTASLAVLLVGGSVGGYLWYSRTQEQRAGTAFTAALMTYQAPVQAGLPPLPGQGPEKVFTSEKEKYETALKEFAAIRTDFPRTQGAFLAGLYQALCQNQLGDLKAAVAILEQVGQVRDPNVAAEAQLTLAGFYQKLGRPQDAEKLYRQLAAKPTVTVPRSMALLELAAMKAESDPAEARRLYDEIKKEFADTDIAAEVSRRMELLPAPPEAGPAPAPAPAQP